MEVITPHLTAERIGAVNVPQVGEDIVWFNQEVVIRNTFAVGILAVATLAAASLFIRRRRVVLATAGFSRLDVDDLYEAGL